MSAEGGSQQAENSDLSGVLTSIRQKMAAACQRVGRNESEVTLMAVSKTVTAARVRAAILAGVKVLGENRVQEAEAKIAALADLRTQVEWHLIGHLQANKARKAATIFDVVQSVDSEDLALKLDRVAEEFGKRLTVFIEVNLGGEASKAGVTAAATLPLIEKVSRLPNLTLAGLMSVPPYSDQLEEVRPFFRRLRALRDEALQAGVAASSCTQLSMGMSHDFEIAIEEGATLIRLGTALFGNRNYVL